MSPTFGPGKLLRAGSQVHRTLYLTEDGDEKGVLVGMVDTPELAAHVVRAVNAWDWGSEPSEGRKVLDTPMNDEYPTIGDYLTALLTRLWTELNAFSGKYGLGNSDWYWELYTALVKAGMVDGTFDEDDCLYSCNEPEAHRLIHAAIRELGAAR